MDTGFELQRSAAGLTVRVQIAGRVSKVSHGARLCNVGLQFPDDSEM